MAHPCLTGRPETPERSNLGLRCLPRGDPTTSGRWPLNVREAHFGHALEVPGEPDGRGSRRPATGRVRDGVVLRFGIRFMRESGRVGFQLPSEIILGGDPGRPTKRLERGASRSSMAMGPRLRAASWRSLGGKRGVRGLAQTADPASGTLPQQQALASQTLGFPCRGYCRAPPREGGLPTASIFWAGRVAWSTGAGSP